MLRTPSLEPVSLNVGGTLYTTSSETLTRYPDSMLGAMFKGQLSSRRDQAGNLFIDRDGKPFRHILNYLRSSHLDLPEGYRELRLLKREADFYQVGPLLEELVAQQQDRGYALLQCNILSQTQTLHFNQKQGPLNYALSTCSLTVYRARLFSTCPGFLGLLSARLGLPWPPEPGPTGPAGPSGPAGPAGPTGPAAPPCRLELAWAPRPPELPEGEYARLGLGRLRAQAGQRELADAPAFVEELLQAALGQRYRVDSLLPDPGDILNCTALRFLRY
ncbi:BTB/POZ domain-containing protein KCTD21-like [Cetorhinus maximus]